MRSGQDVWVYGFSTASKPEWLLRRAAAEQQMLGRCAGGDAAKGLAAGEGPGVPAYLDDRVIPSWVKLEVWNRDQGQCVSLWCDL